MSTKNHIAQTQKIVVIVLLLISLLMPTYDASANKLLQEAGPFEKQLPASGVRTQAPVTDEVMTLFAGPNLIQDPSFEASYGSTFYWGQFSTNFGTPLCIIADCNNGGGTAGPRTGNVWGWFGGTPNNELADVYQDVTFPACGGATLQFYLWIGFAEPGSDANDTFIAAIDGNTIFTTNATQKSSYPSYTLVSINVSSYANGAVHQVEFLSSTSGQAVTFNLDDVALIQSGNCIISGNTGAGGVTLSYTDGTPKTVTSLGNGSYSFPVSYNWSGTVTPSHTCFTFTPPNIAYTNVTSPKTSQNYTANFNSGAGCTEIDVLIGGASQGSHGVPAGKSTADRYKLNGGPVHVVSTDGVTPIFTSQRAIFGNSFNSIVGYPGNQLTTDYWFTSYDDVGMITYLVIGNPHPSNTALVDVYIGGVKKNASPYSIGPGQRIFPRFGINSGPVHVVSTNGVNIFTSERTKFGNSFNEVMGYPGNQLTTEYWFTSYDDAGMITYLVVGNPHTSQTAEVDVYIGGVKQNATPIQIAPGQRIFPRYGINSGPVRVVSTNGVNVFASERTKFGNTFNEVLGYPGNQVHTEFWFSSYDDLGMITYLVVGNPHATLTAEVDVYIGGVKKNATPIQIAAGQRYFARYGLNGGPVRVVSTNGVNVFASERSKYQSSFNEILGIADNQLTTDYWFTSYDDIGMIAYLVLGTP